MPGAVGRIEQVALHAAFGAYVGENHSRTFVNEAFAAELSEQLRRVSRQFQRAVGRHGEFEEPALVGLRHLFPMAVRE